MRLEARLLLVLLIGCGQQTRTQTTTQTTTDSTNTTGTTGATGSTGVSCSTTMCGGACVDLKTNASHCGACFHPCSASCNDGLCPATAIVSNDPTRSIAIAHDSTHVYWISGNTLRRVGKDGTGNTLVADVAAPGLNEFSLAVDDTYLYYMTPSGIGRVAKSGGVPADVVTGINPSYFAMDASNLYWSDRSAHEIAYAPKAGGTKLQIAGNLKTPRNIAVDAYRVYWTDGGTLNNLDQPIANDGGVSFAGKSVGAAVTTVRAGLEYVGEIAVGGVGFLWSEQSSGVFSGTIAAPPVVTKTSEIFVFDIVADGDTIFLSSSNGVWMKRSQDQDFFPLYREATNIYSICVDPSFLYVSMNPNGSTTKIMKIPR